MEPSDNYGFWKLPEIRAELKARGALVRGKKAELIDRLRDYDRNANFGSLILEDDTSFKITLPPPENFKDLHGGTNLPINVTRRQIETYLDRYNRKVDKKSENLYNSRFVQYVKCCEFQRGFFFSSACKATMKKLVYHVDVLVDSESTIQQTQCECAAGLGPHALCKHVVAVLLALEDFMCRQTLQLELTGTSILQGFHVPKVPYNKSPIKARNMQFRDKIVRSNVFDPRPENQRNLDWYKTYFRNICISVEDHNMAIMQSIEAANPHGIENDHNYSKLNCVDALFESMGLLNMSEQKVAQIEKATRGQQNNKRWFYERSFRISSTSFKHICGATIRRNLRALSVSILNKTKFSCKAVRHGICNEKVAINKYKQRTGNDVQECGTFVIKSYPFLCASPDGLVNDDTVLEVKCPYTRRYDNITHISIPYLCEVNSALNLKKNHLYYYQIMGQLWATGRQFCDLVIYTYCDLKIIKIERDQNFIDNMNIRLLAFYDAYFYPALKNKYFYKE